MRWTALLLALLAVPAMARDESRGTAGRFDYYVLSLSWSPQHCAGPDGERDDLQCAGPRRYAFVLHGLWPQYERGFPRACGGAGRLSPALVESMLDVMPSPALVRHEWATHGTCSGLAAPAYFDAARRAFAAVTIPERFRAPVHEVYAAPRAVEREFLRANPPLTAAGVAVLCTGRYLQEVRVCLDRALRPRACGADVRDRCRGAEIIVRPLR